METRHIQDGLDLYFPPSEREAAEVVEAACGHSISVIRDLWGLAPPSQCTVYIMTSWPRFIFQSAPWYACVPFAVFFPFWARRVRRLWKSIGGWTQLYRGRPVIGIKPPRLIAESDRTFGEKVLIPEPDFCVKMQRIVCHEMTHAFSASLRLPLWLNEGIAMVAVDRFAGRPTVKPETLQELEKPVRRRPAGTYQRLPGMTTDDRVYHYVRGYWITRYLMDTRPGLLQDLLRERQSHRSLEKGVSSALGLSRRAFWLEIDPRICEHF